MLKKAASRSKSKHFKNSIFLKALGHHCQKLRSQKGYSIDRLAKESEQLSSSVIHRLETGQGAVTVSALFRYAGALGIQPKELLDFEFPFPSLGASGRNEVQNFKSSKGQRKILPLEDRRIRDEAFETLLPLYSIRAAAGYFGKSETVRPEGWIEVERERKFDPKTFVVRAVGNSMLPKIHDGDYLVFLADPAGSKQGKIVLAQYRGPADPETGGSYTVKKYSSSKIASPEGGWRHKQITLSPLNPDYESITLFPENEADFKVVAEYLFSL